MAAPIQNRASSLDLTTYEKLQEKKRNLERSVQDLKDSVNILSPAERALMNMPMIIEAINHGEASIAKLQRDIASLNLELFLR